MKIFKFVFTWDFFFVWLQEYVYRRYFWNSYVTRVDGLKVQRIKKLKPFFKTLFLDMKSAL